MKTYRLGVRHLLLLGVFLCAGKFHAEAQEEELRGIWVDAWGAGIKTPGQIDQLIQHAQAANFNAIFPQIRKRGDAYYDSLIEPKASDIHANFDPLAYLIQEAHAAHPPIEVHAWVVAYPLWSNQNASPPQPNHVYNSHPEWLTQNRSGAKWDGETYQLDPGHPGVQEHLYEIAMDIISGYDVDGLQLDYIRYAGNAWGYNPVSVQRFNTLYNRSGTPLNTDSDWLQFRRDQVTDLLRKIYLSAMEIDPSVAISAATITWGNGVSSTSQWPNSAAYSSVLQDWRAWMEEGILDWNIPMTYYNHATHATAYERWNTFIKNHAYERNVAIGPGVYLNSIPNSLAQIEVARETTSAGNSSQGVVAYSYRVTNKDGEPRSAFLNALAGSGGSGDFIVDNSDFGFSASPNWQTGTGASGKFGNDYRFRSVASISDSAEWSVHLPSAGNYEVFAWWSEGGNRSAAAPYIVYHPGGSDTVNQNQQINGGQWNSLGTYSLNAGLNTVRLSCWTISGSVVIADAIRWKAVDAGGPFGSPAIVPEMTWKTNPQKGHLKGFVFDGTLPVDGAVVTLSGPETRSVRSDATGFYGFVDLAPGTYTVTATYGSVNGSANVSVSTGNVRDEALNLSSGGGPSVVIVDNSDAGFSASGNWSVATWASDKYGANYSYRDTASVSDAAIFTAHLPSAGTYNVYAWWAAAGNRATAAPYFVDHAEGSQVVNVDQTTNGGKWNLLGSFYMNAGSNTVRLSCWTSSGEVVIADAIKWEKQ